MAREIKYFFVIIVFLSFSLLSFSQSTALQVGIVSHSPNNRFCSGVIELFQLEGRVSGGTGPYNYEWTFPWSSDTLRTQTIFIQPSEGGDVKLKVTDSSHPKIIREVKYHIYEIKLTADFTFSADGACAQSPVTFTPAVSGGTPVYSYYWVFGDGNSSNKTAPVNEFIASGCSGLSSFNVQMQVMDADGCNIAVNKIIQVKNKPHLDFSDIANPYSPFKHCPDIMDDPTFEVRLDNATYPVTCITGYKVDWGDGSTESSVTFPKSHTYTKAGAFELVVTADNSSGCELVWRHFVFNQSSPAAGIESLPGTEGCAPKRLPFHLTGYENNTVGTTYTWDFGDGTSIEVWDHDLPYVNDTVKHTYNTSSCERAGGIFSTSVTVTNGCGTKKATVDGIRIWTKPQASINHENLTLDTICVNEQIQLGNSSTSGYYGSLCSSLTQYNWNFDNGTSSATQTMPPVSWPVPGEYDVVLSVGNPCGTTTDTFKIVVIDPPLAKAIVDRTEGCAPFTPKFTNSSTGYRKFQWEVSPDTGFTFINGTNAKSLEPEISFNSKGKYKVVLSVSNNCRTDSVVFNFNVFSEPDGRIKNLSNICISDPIIHPLTEYNENGRPVTSFEWAFPGGSPSVSSDRDPGVHTYAASGVYSVTLTLKNECGSTTIDSSFYVQPKPAVKVNSPATICESDSLVISGTTVDNSSSVKWLTTGDGYFTDATLLNPVYHPGSNDLMNSGVILRVVAGGVSPCGADSAIVQLIIKKGPHVTIDDDVTVCEGNPYTVSKALAGNYASLLWHTGGDGHFSDPAVLLPVYYPGSSDLAAGHVEITLEAGAIDPCHMNASDAMVITYARNPLIDAGADKDICENGEVQLSASGTGFTAVNWLVVKGSGTVSDPSALNPTFKLTSGLTEKNVLLVVKAAGGFGCPEISDTVKLSVIPLPVVFAGDDAIVCESGSYKIADASVLEYKSIVWKVNGDGTLDDYSAMNPVFIPGPSDKAAGNVTLTLTAEGNSVCSSVTDVLALNIQKVPVADAGADQEVCKSNNFATAGKELNGSSFRWSTLGTGTFENQEALATTYHPSENDKSMGVVSLVLTVNGIAPCMAPATDTIRLIFIDIPVISAGKDTAICSSSYSQVDAYALNSTQYQWTSSGSGTWDNAGSVSAIYYPSASDISAGSVVLTLASRNTACPLVSDNMTLRLTPFPVSKAGQDELICEDSPLALSDSRCENYSSVEWKSTGDGYFSDKNALHPFYYSGTGDIATGYVRLYLVVNGLSPCIVPAIDTLTLTVQKNPVVVAGADVIIGEGEQFTAAGASAQNVNKLTWSTTGDGTFADVTDVNCTYIHGENDLRNRGVDLIIRGTSNSPCTKIVTDTVHLAITPKPFVDAGTNEKICEGSDFVVTSSKAREYSKLWWTSSGTGSFDNDSILTPVYHPGPEDVAKRIVVLKLHARGNMPITGYVVSDSMQLEIVHNTNANLIAADTACANIAYQISDISYRDENVITWSSSGSGSFSGTTVKHPVYTFSAADAELDSVYFYVRVSSLDPCVQVVNDTLKIRLFHEPVTSFLSDKAEGCAPLEVLFTNTSEGEELKFSWSFGNGLESNSKAPETVIFEQGRIADTVYTVVLRATNRCNSVISTKDILAKPVPVVNFGMDVTWGCSPKTIQLFNITTGLPDSYLWKWGDGKENSDKENPGSHIFETGVNDTTYTITLTARNECGIDSLRKTVVILPNKVKAFFESDTTMGCAPLTVSFTNFSRGVLGNRPFLSWSWNFGDGTVSDSLHPHHCFTKPGKYKVTLFVNDTCSFDSFTTEIDVLEAPSIDFITDRPDYCTGDTVLVTPVNIKPGQISGILWDFGDSTNGSGFNEQHIYSAPGKMNIVLSAGDFKTGCRATTTKSVNIHPTPDAGFSITDNYEGNPLQISIQNSTTNGESYEWDFGDTMGSSEENPWHKYPDYGIFKVNLTAETRYNCRDTAFRSIELKDTKWLMLPNALAPANASQGVREFKATGSGLREYDLVIYDTWGNLIWETTRLEDGKPAESWDGTYNGKSLPPDVYVWHLKKVVNADGSPYNGPRYGSILLIK